MTFFATSHGMADLGGICDLFSGMALLPEPLCSRLYTAILVGGFTLLRGDWESSRVSKSCLHEHRIQPSSLG